MRRLGIFAAALLAVGVVAPVYAPAPPAEAQEGNGQCELDSETLDCSVQAPVPGPVAPPDTGSDNGSGDDSGDGQQEGESEQGPNDVQTAGADSGCAEYLVTGAAADPYRAEFPDAPPDQNFYICQEPDGNVRVRLAPPVAEDEPPDPAEIAVDLLAEVQSQMHAPEVVMDPPVGTASIITLPVFVQVTNWVGTIEEGDCPEGVCVTLTAVPTLTFDPGEPGSSPIECDPPGTRFDPEGADPEIQAAAPGACAHVYEHRTGVEGRPEAWPAEVTVSWAVSWTAPGVSEELPPQELSTPVPREVDEVQTVVRNGAS